MRRAACRTSIIHNEWMDQCFFIRSRQTYLVTMVVGPLANPLESSSTTLTSSPLLGERGSLLMVTTLVPANTAIGCDML